MNIILFSQYFSQFCPKITIPIHVNLIIQRESTGKKGRSLEKFEGSTERDIGRPKANGWKL